MPSKLILTKLKTMGVNLSLLTLFLFGVTIPPNTYEQNEAEEEGVIRDINENSKETEKVPEEPPLLPPSDVSANTTKPSYTNKPITKSSNLNSPQVKKTGYPIHSNIYTTMFWVGEDASSDNGYISNAPSAWISDWVSSFGGVDDPNNRNGYQPSGFTPKENPFYFALPYGDYGQNGLKSNINRVYWYTPVASGQSILKNRWIKITANGKTAYAQWEDVGPWLDNDIDYVFGTNAPSQKAALDVSPAVSDYLGLNGGAYTSWQFVDENEIVSGPWKNIITRTPPSW